MTPRKKAAVSHIRQINLDELTREQLAFIVESICTPRSLPMQVIRARALELYRSVGIHPDAVELTRGTEVLAPLVDPPRGLRAYTFEQIGLCLRALRDAGVRVRSMGVLTVSGLLANFVDGVQGGEKAARRQWDETVAALRREVLENDERDGYDGARVKPVKDWERIVDELFG